jgi:hypothetical protein
MRADVATVFLVASAVATIGCIGRKNDPMDPSDFRASPRELEPPRTAPNDPRRTVRVACDDEGNLHVRAPDGVRVTTPIDARENAAAEIQIDDGAPAQAQGEPTYGYVAAWGRYAYRNHRPSLTLSHASPIGR